MSMTTHDPQVAVEARRLFKRYGVVAAVNDVSFTVGRGEVFGFLGANGAGKTTTLRMLCGLLKPTSGNVFIDGIDSFVNPLLTKARIGYLDEEPFVHPHLTGREFLNYIADLYRMPRGAQRSERMERLLRLFELADRDGELIGGYSHGMRQKIGLAVRQPCPRGRLPKNATRVERMKRKLQTKAGRAVYAARKTIVEPVFGQIKQARGFRQFLLRGGPQVAGEFTLVALTHNLLKLWRRRPALVTA